MLTIHVPETEFWDDRSESFIYGKKFDLQLEHSLISVSKWESKWQKAYLSQIDMTEEQVLDYIRCMTLNPNTPEDVYHRLTDENYNQIVDYIQSPMTATWFNNDQKGKSNNEKVTSELIYYWMIALQIPFECQKWHLNRLLTLIRVCNIKNQPPKKMSQSELARRNRALNEARRKQFNTRG